jgi:D-beta-D-heptose 7-phosphate kinase/D-beta-D-heptose 1-phosphate adenosyltransferase
MNTKIIPARNKVLEDEAFLNFCHQCRLRGLQIVFTNGCFDILHIGHLRYLEEARAMGDVLVVGVNSDSSVKRIKGALRPIMPEMARAELVAGLHCVDAVTIFDTPTPLPLISHVKPDVLVKGGDWALDAIVGKDIVESYGGQVRVVPILEGYSTTEIINKILSINKISPTDP